MELLAAGNLWVLLLIFPAQSRNATNTTLDQPGFHWCTLVSWFHTLDHCADKEHFFAENTAPCSFCCCLSFPKSLHPWPCSGHVCHLRSGILILPQFCYRTPTSSSTCSLLKLCAVVYLPLRSLNALWLMAFSNMYFPFVCTASSFTSAFRYHSLTILA